MARALVASPWVAILPSVALCACIEPVDFRSGATDAMTRTDLSAPLVEPPSELDAGYDAGPIAMGDSDAGSHHEPDASVDAAPITDGPIEGHDVPIAPMDSGAPADGEPLDTGANGCEIAGFDCLDSATYGGVCPAPRVAEAEPCTRLAGRERICCSRI